MPPESAVNPQDEKSLTESKAMARGLLNQWTKSSPISEKPLKLPEDPKSPEIDVDKIIDTRLETIGQRKIREAKAANEAVMGVWSGSKPTAEVLRPTEEELSVTEPTKETAKKLNLRSAAPDEWDAAQEEIEQNLETPEARQERLQKQKAAQEAKEKQERINLEKLENKFGEMLFRTLIKFEISPPELLPEKDGQPPKVYEQMTKHEKIALAGEGTAYRLTEETIRLFPDKPSPTSILMNIYTSILKDQGETLDSPEEMERTLEEYATKNKLLAAKEQPAVTPAPIMSPQERRAAALKRTEEMSHAAAQTAAAMNGEDSKRTMAG